MIQKSHFGPKKKIPVRKRKFFLGSIFFKNPSKSAKNQWFWAKMKHFWSKMSSFSMKIIKNHRFRKISSKPARFARVHKYRSGSQARPRSGEHNAPLIRFAHEPPLAAWARFARVRGTLASCFAGLRCAKHSLAYTLTGFLPLLTRARECCSTSLALARVKTGTGRDIYPHPYLFSREREPRALQRRAARANKKTKSTREGSRSASQRARANKTRARSS